MGWLRIKETAQRHRKIFILGGGALLAAFVFLAIAIFLSRRDDSSVCYTRDEVLPNATYFPNSTITYVPGELSMKQMDILLSTGLSARRLAVTGTLVEYYGKASIGNSSMIPFHAFPDAGATFNDTRIGNVGGWIYVSNSEVSEPKNSGGVGALTFDKDGQVIDYRRILNGTDWNCGGGRTPWNTWISCEEHGEGRIWQVDPTGERQAEPISLGDGGYGKFESFAYDNRFPHYFVTEDHDFGPLRRHIPTTRNETDSWQALHGSVAVDYLILNPDGEGGGSYEWTKNKDESRFNANAHYPNSEGIDVDGSQLFFISKKLKTMFILNLDDGSYHSQSTRSGVFDGQPDQLQRILGTDDELLYFTEDGGAFAGVHARDRDGNFFTILEGSRCNDETTGLAFSPDGKHLYFAFQDKGEIFDITRDDGFPFHFKSMNVKYHDATSRDSPHHSSRKSRMAFLAEET